MVSVIVNADDFGANNCVNAAIENAIKEGVISSTTIMANGLSFDSAVEFAKKNRNVSYGVHLNLTQFQSLTNPKIFQELKIMDSPSYKQVFPSGKMTRELLQAVEGEWIAQIEKFISSGLGLPSHIDSHHHVHTRPSLFLALKAVQKYFGIKKVRNTANVYTDLYKVSFAKKTGKFIWSYCLKNIYKTKTTDNFLSYSEFISLPTINKDKIYELMCHPGGQYHSEDDLVGQNAISRKDVKLISYNEL